jgi:hypothetical protein
MTDPAIILNEFAEWQAEKQNGRAPDLTVEAFLKERQDGLNESRVRRALEVADFATRFTEDMTAFSQEDAKRFLVRLNEIKAILVGDRPYQLDQTITGETRRIFT